MLDLIRLFVKKYPEYVQVALDKIPENQAVLQIAGNDYPVVFFNALYEPQLIGVSVPTTLADGPALQNASSLFIQEGLIAFSIRYEWLIGTDTANVVLYTVTKADIRTGFIGKKYLARFFNRALIRKNHVIDVFDFNIYLKLISFFYHPKPVFLICTAAAKTKNTFPVDTCRKIGNTYIFGARRSNSIINASKPGDKIAVGLADFTKRSVVYQLGKYSTERSEIPFMVDHETGIFVPEVVCSYEIVTLARIIEYAGQNIYVCQAATHEKNVNQNPFLAHVHKFWLASGHANTFMNFKSI